MSGIARPGLNTPAQIARWRGAGGGACDVMVDTGMNRLGVAPEDVAGGLLDGLAIDTLMSHLACADEDTEMNARQRDAFAALAGRTGARRPEEHTSELPSLMRISYSVFCLEKNK